MLAGGDLSDGDGFPPFLLFSLQNQTVGVRFPPETTPLGVLFPPGMARHRIALPGDILHRIDFPFLWRLTTSDLGPGFINILRGNLLGTWSTSPSPVIFRSLYVTLLSTQFVLWFCSRCLLSYCLGSWPILLYFAFVPLRPLVVNFEKSFSKRILRKKNEKDRKGGKSF